MNVLMRVVPWGLRKVFNWLKDNYGNPLVIVTENGYGENKSVAPLYDYSRVGYLMQCTNEMLKGSNVLHTFL